ncbi:hypothetical protein MGG_17370 [Pyricularia oryzae 70-15]|uniref:Uncharacterized protein n=1 Tax=Pyricularia oryzae (strain 70-15 / ATCC MYA-4617 / FGSC 8958) TaxID=242507 RepID=G4NEK7_PYRO7|nr:uncharacterized protein MGG_17370 [Pyricularia oryzae 70-15]EHA48637.1 hypothetical protein MGG_17370 [Pyricularia oryzae 70-15]
MSDAVRGFSYDRGTLTSPETMHPRLGKVRTTSTDVCYTNQGRASPHSSTCLAKLRKASRPLPTPSTDMSYVARLGHARTLQS